MKHKHRKLRKKSYGSKRKLVWCDKCDQDLVLPQAVKKTERQKAKKEIKNETNEMVDKKASMYHLKYS
jgi:hypothetical protein